MTSKKEKEIIERLLTRVREVAETAILARGGGEDDFRRAMASHTLSPLDCEVMAWVNDQLGKERAVLSS